MTIFCTNKGLTSDENHSKVYGIFLLRVHNNSAIHDIYLLFYFYNVLSVYAMPT